MIKIENLTKRYGEHNAVSGISITVEDGEIVGFLGPNGAGKTTTMSMITGFLSSTSGEAVINGVNVLDDPINAKKNIGYLPEFPPLYLEMTVKEYLNFVYDLKGCHENREAHIGEICERVGLTSVFSRVIRNLSKGYRQRVGIAQALIGNPKVIIFDEPTNGLDPKQVVEIRNLVKDLGKDHTVILSTHILSEVQLICDRIIIINKGRIVADERTENIEKVMTGGRQLQLKVCGPSSQVLQTIRDIQGVSYAEILGPRESESTAYLVEFQAGLDMRRPIFNVMASKGWPIIGMESIGMNIEDIFIAAVDDGASDKDKKKNKKKAKKL